MEHQLTQGDCREEHKEEGEDKLRILADGSCENQRESIDGCSQVYAGGIDIIFKNDFAIQISHEDKYEEIVAANEEPRSTSPSPLEIQ